MRALRGGFGGQLRRVVRVRAPLLSRDRHRRTLLHAGGRRHRARMRTESTRRQRGSAAAGSRTAVRVRRLRGPGRSRQRPRAFAGAAVGRAVLRAARSEHDWQGAVPPRVSAGRAGRVRDAQGAGRRRHADDVHGPDGRGGRARARRHGGDRVRWRDPESGAHGRPGDRLPGVAVRTSDGPGPAADAKEAYAFAVLGFLACAVCRASGPRAPGRGTRACSVRSLPGGADCGCRHRSTSRPCGWSSAEVRILSSRFHRGLIRWGHDAGDSSRVVSRPGADE